VLIRVPEWPQPLVAVLAMVVLAALDLLGAVAAKEAVTHRSGPHAVAGAVAFLALFWVYASSPRYADLAPVTFGWNVALQVGLLLIDRFRYDVSLPTGKWGGGGGDPRGAGLSHLRSHGNVRDRCQDRGVVRERSRQRSVTRCPARSPRSPTSGTACSPISPSSGW
jgi:hypothetical protein